MHVSSYCNFNVVLIKVWERTLKRNCNFHPEISIENYRIFTSNFSKLIFLHNTAEAIQCYYYIISYLFHHGFMHFSFKHLFFHYLFCIGKLKIICYIFLKFNFYNVLFNFCYQKFEFFLKLTYTF